MRLDPVKPAAPEEEISEAELLLTVERVLTLVPPEGVGEFPTVDTFATEVERPIRGPSLFERIAMVTRGAARDVSVSEVGAGDWTEQRIARRA